MSILGQLYDAAKEMNAKVQRQKAAPPPAPASKAAPAPSRPSAGKAAIPADLVPGASTLREGIRRRQRIMDEL